MLKTVFTLIFLFYVVMAEFYLDLERNAVSQEETELKGLLPGPTTIVIILVVLAVAVGSIILLGCCIGCCCSRMATDVTRRIHL